MLWKKKLKKKKTSKNNHNLFNINSYNNHVLSFFSVDFVDQLYPQQVLLVIQSHRPWDSGLCAFSSWFVWNSVLWRQVVACISKKSGTGKAGRVRLLQDRVDKLKEQIEKLRECANNGKKNIMELKEKLAKLEKLCENPCCKFCLITLLLYFHGNELRSYRDCRLLNHTVPMHASKEAVYQKKGPLFVSIL